MVGETGKRFVLEDILNEKQVHHIVKQCVGEDVSWELKRTEARAATDGLAGFLGDHIRATLHLMVEGEEKCVHLFIKCLPMNNQPKAEFIDSRDFFRREKTMFKLIDEIADRNDPKPWCPQAYLYTDSIIVMPDLAIEGYASRFHLDYLDLRHMLCGAANIARFHAAFTNYETNKSIAGGGPYNTNQELGSLLKDPLYCDCPWMRSCAKVTAKFIKDFSSKSYRNIPDLETKILNKYLIASDGVTEVKGTLNVLIHKDLWVNNIMFKYENNAPINALFVDFQLIKYAPPVFDLIPFIYLTTSKSFRNEHYKKICEYYFSAFCDNLNNDSKQRMKDLGYDKEHFMDWCERARMFGLVEASAVYPIILMDSKIGQETFDNPDTYDKLINGDRTEPVVAYARKSKVYRERILEVSEEFVERYVLTDL